MKKFKRILAALLSMLMLVSAMSFTAMADEASGAPAVFAGELEKAGKDTGSAAVLSGDEVTLEGAELDETLALSNLLINYDQAGSHYPKYSHFGVAADDLAASEITITLPYGWDTNLVPQPGTYADVTTNGNPKNMVIVPVVTEGTAV